RPQRFQRRETIHARQPEVEEDHIRPPGPRFANRLLPAPHRTHVEVVIAETCAQSTLHLDLVVDHQNAAAHELGTKGTAASGKVKVKRGPRRRFSARMVPPCASTTRLQMARPRPLPRARRLQDVSK